MTEFNRPLYLLIGHVTEGTFWPLRDLVEDHGRPLVARVLADGFGVVFVVPEESGDVSSAFFECQFLSLDETLGVVEEPVIPHGYWCHEAPGALDPQMDGKLLRRYASDDPEAVAEVRRVHAERREPAERMVRECAKSPHRPG